MKNLLFLVSTLVLFLSACQKEVSTENPDANPGTGPVTPQPTGLLVRSVSVAGGDSAMVDYVYDANNRLLTYNYTTTGTAFRYRRIVRNSAGIMTQFSSKGQDLASVGVDSAVTVLTYNAAQSRYEYGITLYSLGGTPLRDSAAYEYDGSGNLIRKTSFATVVPAPYQQYQKTEYTYVSGNITSEKYYTFNNAGTWDLEHTYNYTYDTRVNPIKLGPEALIVLDDASYFNNNNVTVLSYVDGVDATYNYSLAHTYTYNNDNKPSGGTVVETPGSASYNLRYYYK